MEKKKRIRRILIPTTIFENMGMTYLGPVDGHDVGNLIFLLRTAKEMKRPVLLHVHTQKGKGYAPAEENPAKFHGIGKFDPATGKKLGAKTRSFSDSFGDTMLELAEKYPEYGFKKHKGYPTAEHRAKVIEIGPCPEHRRSFLSFAKRDSDD